uniref:Uncharacterized protein LOC114349266 n=1 Tax=Diabrotica virgifera virgifera TaxID=50390 RepID=A0A6P7H1L4_DIAVI
MPKWARGKLQDHYEDSAILHLERANQIKKAVLQVISGQKTLREAAAINSISKSALQRHVSKYKAISGDETEKYDFTQKHGYKSVFTEAQEAMLTHVNTCNTMLTLYVIFT